MSKQREFVILAGETFKSGPMTAEQACMDMEHFYHGCCAFRLIEVSLATVKAQEARERAKKGARR